MTVSEHSRERVYDALKQADEAFRKDYPEDLSVASTTPKIDVHSLKDLTGLSRTTIMRALDDVPWATRFTGWRDEPLFVFRSPEALAVLAEAERKAESLRANLRAQGFTVSDSDWAGAPRYEGEDAVVAVDAEGKISVLLEGDKINKVFAF